MSKYIGIWVGIGIALSSVMGCRNQGSASAGVYVSRPWSPPTPSYRDRDQRARYHDFYTQGGYESEHGE